MTDKKVVSIFGGEYSEPHEMAPNEELIKILTHLLDWAKKGYVQEVVITAGLSDGNVISDYEGYIDEAQTMFGELTNMALLYRDIYLNPLSPLLEDIDGED